MNLAKGLARSVTRRQALKKFGVGLAGRALACFGLANRAEVHNDLCFQVRDSGSKNREDKKRVNPKFRKLPTRQNRGWLRGALFVRVEGARAGEARQGPRLLDARGR